MSKKKPVRYGSHQYNLERKKEVIKAEARLNHRDKLKIYLSYTIGELKEMNHPLYDIIHKAFPTLHENATIDDARLTKLFDKMFREGSIKTLELSYKLDGSMSDLTNDPDFDEIDSATEGIK